MPKHRKRSRLEEARAKMYRELVFECAEHAFAERGFDDATMQEIAGEAGISLKTLYAATPGKNELYREIQELRGAEFFESVAGAMDTATTALDKLSAGVHAYVDFLLAHQNFLRIHLRERVAWGLGPTSSAGAEVWNAGLEVFAAVVRQGIDEGAFHDGDPQTLAAMGIAVMQVQLGRIAERAGDSDAERASEEILEPLRRMLCRPASDLAAA